MVLALCFNFRQKVIAYCPVRPGFSFKDSHMNSYYVRISEKHIDGINRHLDVEATCPEMAAVEAMRLARDGGMIGELLITVYQQVGTHNILTQRDPLLVV